jgi:hypothetical protein
MSLMEYANVQHSLLTLLLVQCLFGNTELLHLSQDVRQDIVFNGQRSNSSINSNSNFNINSSSTRYDL